MPAQLRRRRLEAGRRCLKKSGKGAPALAIQPSLCERIEKAFGHRQMPTEVVEPEAYTQFDSDVEDALTFAGKDWREITREHWSKHYCAFHFLSHEALAYYLPSLLIIPLADRLDHMDMAVDSLIHDLDRTPLSSPEDYPFECRLAGLTCDEYEVIKEWLLLEHFT